MSLYIVSTPIGNLKDITIRAVETLEKADLVLAEDTRRTLTLLNHYKIKVKLQSYNDINKVRVTPTIINILKKNMIVALVSDSGTPTISDPGFYLIREAIRNDIKPIPVPGPSASITALTIAGLPTDKFNFIGFAPKKVTPKMQLFKEIKESKTTSIIYESPHRISKTLRAMADIMPDAKVVIARELTKKFEQCIRGTAKELDEKYRETPIKGEITLIVKNE